MKRLVVACAVVIAVILPGATVASARSSRPATDFAAALDARQEVQTPPVVSRATGKATFDLSGDGMKLHFRLSARGLGRITMAHIHMAAKGVNGPVVAVLFPMNSGVDGEGFEVAGTITAVDLMGPLANKPLASLVQAMRSGNTYANVHTIAHGAGEIRGQIHASDDDR